MSPSIDGSRPDGSSPSRSQGERSSPPAKSKGFDTKQYLDSLDLQRFNATYENEGDALIAWIWGRWALRQFISWDSWMHASAPYGYGWHAKEKMYTKSKQVILEPMDTKTAQALISKAKSSSRPLP